MPEITVCAVSSSVRTWKVGSSSESRWSATPSLSSSALDLGSIATSTTGSGKCMASSRIGYSGSHSVVPVVTRFTPITAAMSPANTSEISSRLFACICTSRPTRSLAPLVEFSTASPVFTVPE